MTRIMVSTHALQRMAAGGPAEPPILVIQNGVMRKTFEARGPGFAVVYRPRDPCLGAVVYVETDQEVALCGTG